MPENEKQVSFTVKRYNLYLNDEPSLSEPDTVIVEKGLFTYMDNGDLELIVLKEKEFETGFALVNLDDTATSFNLIYLYDQDGEHILDLVDIEAELSGRKREKVGVILDQVQMPREKLALVSVDGYEYYGGTKVTKFLPLRRSFSL